MDKSKILRVAAVLGAVAIIGAAALSVGPTYAARGGKGGGGQTTTSSIKLNQSDPHLGDWVTFSTSGSGSKIQLACYGLGLEVIYAVDQAVGTAFLLGGTSSKWLSRGGSSECYAWLIGRDMSKVYAVTNFVAGGAR